MAKRTYRTASGKQLDIGAIQLKQEKTPAIGNMRVNARGDELTPDGRIARRREEVVQDTYYKMHGMVPQEDEIIESTGPTKKVVPTPPRKQVQADPVVEQPIEEVLQPEEEVDAVLPETNPEPSLSASVASSQASKGTQEVKSDRQRKRSISGVKRV